MPSGSSQVQNINLHETYLRFLSFYPIFTVEHTMFAEWFSSQPKPKDRVLKDTKSDDLVIPVMGGTGSGKSTFINHIAGTPVMAVNDGLVSCTQELTCHIIAPIPDHPGLAGKRLILVDTPGFGDTYVDDTEILRRIAVWLESSYNDKATVAGVIYLYDVGAPRMTSEAIRNQGMFEKLCGKDALSRVILGTTKGEAIPEQVMKKKDADLVKTFWKDMIKAGSTMRSVEDNPTSAWSTINLILSKLTVHDQSYDALCIQKELVDLQKSIPRTAAGRELRRQLKVLLEQQKRGFKECDRGGKQKLDALLRQINELGHRPSSLLSRKIRSLFGLL